jgi:hypothetical protein
MLSVLPDQLLAFLRRDHPPPKHRQRGLPHRIITAVVTVTAVAAVVIAATAAAPATAASAASAPAPPAPATTCNTKPLPTTADAVALYVPLRAGSIATPIFTGSSPPPTGR